MSKVYKRVAIYYNYVSHAGASASQSAYVRQVSVTHGTQLPYKYNGIAIIGNYWGTTTAGGVSAYYSDTATSARNMLYIGYSTSSFAYFYIRATTSTTIVATTTTVVSSSSTVSTDGGYIGCLYTGDSDTSITFAQTTGTLTRYDVDTKTVSGKYKKIQDSIISNWTDATGYSTGGEAFDVNFEYNGVSGYKMVMLSMQFQRLTFATDYPDYYGQSYNMTYTGVQTILDNNGTEYTEIDINAGDTIDGDGIFDFGSTEQEIPDTFYQWLIANFEPVGDYTFTFYTADGEEIEQIDGAFAISEMTLTQVGSQLTLTITYSTGTTKTIEWITTIPEGYYFAGLSRTQDGTIYIQPDTTSTTELAYSSNFYEVFLKYGDLPDVEFTINLMQNSAENNRVDKTNYLTNVKTLSGSLRHSTSVVNPTILIDYSTDGAEIPTFNYVYIPAFNRYYYLVDLTSIRTGIWEMRLQCDVLMSYRDTILDQLAFIIRSSNNYNDYINDNVQPMSVRRDITRIDVENTLNDNTHPLITLTGDKTAGTDYSAYIVTVLSTSYTAGDPNSDYQGASVDGLRTQSIAWNTTKYTVKYLLNYDRLCRFTEKLLDPDILNMINQYFTNYDQGAVISIMAYPRDLYDVFNTYYGIINNGQTLNNDAGNIYIYKTKLSGTGSCKLTVNCLNQKWYVGSITFPRVYNSYLDYGQHVTIQLYLPCIGIVNLDTDQVINKTVNIWYVIDWETGKCTAFLETYGDDGTNINLGMYSGQYGTEIAIVSSNMGRITMQGIVGSIGDTVTGVAKSGGNPMAIADTALTAAGDLLGTFTTPAGVQAGKAGQGIENAFMEKSPYAIITRTIPVNVDNFTDVVGKPAGVYTKLKNLSGYNVVGMVHLQNFDTATYGELSEIEQTLRNGIMLDDAETGALSPNTLTFTGAVGATRQTATITLTDADGNAVDIQSAVLKTAELSTNIAVTVEENYPNEMTVVCYFRQAADGDYTVLVTDEYNNHYTLTITLAISNGLSFSQTSVYFDNVTATQTATIYYNGNITGITNPDTDHITTEYDNSTGTLTITYTDPDSTGASVAYLAITDGYTTVSYPVYCVFPLTVSPAIVDIIQNTSADYTVKITGSGSDLNGGGFNITVPDDTFTYTTDNKTYINIVYDAGSVSNGQYVITVDDIMLGTTAGITISVTDGRGALSDTGLTFAGTVGDTRQSVSVTLTDDGGNPITIQSVVASSETLYNNVGLTVEENYPNEITVVCRFDAADSSTYTVLVYDVYNNVYTLTITLDIAENSITATPSLVEFAGSVGDDATETTVTVTAVSGDVTITSAVFDGDEPDGITVTATGATVKIECDYSAELSGNYTLVITDSQGRDCSVVVSIDVSSGEIYAYTDPNNFDMYTSLDTGVYIQKINVYLSDGGQFDESVFFDVPLDYIEFMEIYGTSGGAVNQYDLSIDTDSIDEQIDETIEIPFSVTYNDNLYSGTLTFHLVVN